MGRRSRAVREAFVDLAWLEAKTLADARRGTAMGAVSAGAAGFIVKTAPFNAVLAAMRIVLDGGIPLPVGILERLGLRFGPVQGAAASRASSIASP